jgi:hypothetical protein
MSDVGTPGAPPAPPATPAEARQRLDARLSDKEFGAKLLAGDAATNTEYRDLQNMAANVDPNDAVAVALSGQIGEMPDSSVKMMAETADMLREIGVRESIVEEVLRGHVVTEQELKLTEAWRSRQMKNPAFVRSFLSGDPEARHLMTLSAIIVSGGVKDGRSSF